VTLAGHRACLQQRRDVTLRHQHPLPNPVMRQVPACLEAIKGDSRNADPSRRLRQGVDPDRSVVLSAAAYVRASRVLWFGCASHAVRIGHLIEDVEPLRRLRSPVAPRRIRRQSPPSRVHRARATRGRPATPAPAAAQNTHSVHWASCQIGTRAAGTMSVLAFRPSSLAPGSCGEPRAPALWHARIALVGTVPSQVLATKEARDRPDGDVAAGCRVPIQSIPRLRSSGQRVTCLYSARMLHLLEQVVKGVSPQRTAECYGASSSTCLAS
jgi:hypothetical protein